MKVYVGTKINTYLRCGKMDMRDTIWRSSAKRFDVRETPAIKIFRNGLLVSAYKGIRDATEIVEYIKTEMAKEVRNCCPKHL